MRLQTARTLWLTNMMGMACASGMSSKPPLLVCTTATSIEGQAFCHHALRNQYRVRALCRNPHSSRAQHLAKLGAEVVIADNNDVDSLVKAFEGAQGVYAITTWSNSGFSNDGTVIRSSNLDASFLEDNEYQQGVNILNAAQRSHELHFFVLQSMHQAGRRGIAGTQAPLHHKAKWRLEAELQAAELPCAWAILRQPTYLENFANDETAAQGTQLRLLRPGVVSGLLEPDEDLSVIAVDDLGAIAVAILRHGPAVYGGRIIPVASERINGRNLAAAASRVHGGCTFEYRQVPWWVVEHLIPVAYPKQLKRWLSAGGNDEGARSDAEEYVFGKSRALHPDMLSVEAWLATKGVQDLPTPLWQRRHSTARRTAIGGALASLPALLAGFRRVAPATGPNLPVSALLATSEGKTK